MRKVLTAFVMLAAAAGASALGLACGDDGGGMEYDLTVRFNELATQDRLAETDALLRRHDEDVEFIIMEIFPPIGSATLETDTPDFCATVEAELEAKSYVDSGDCSIAADAGDGDADPNEPVAATPAG